MRLYSRHPRDLNVPWYEEHLSWVFGARTILRYLQLLGRDVALCRKEIKELRDALLKPRVRLTIGEPTDAEEK